MVTPSITWHGERVLSTNFLALRPTSNPTQKNRIGESHFAKRRILLRSVFYGTGCGNWELCSREQLWWYWRRFLTLRLHTYMGGTCTCHVVSPGLRACSCQIDTNHNGECQLIIGRQRSVRKVRIPRTRAAHVKNDDVNRRQSGRVVWVSLCVGDDFLLFLEHTKEGFRPACAPNQTKRFAFDSSVFAYERVQRGNRRQSGLVLLCRGRVFLFSAHTFTKILRRRVA